MLNVLCVAFQLLFSVFAAYCFHVFRKHNRN
jgi:hypothetical protein